MLSFFFNVMQDFSVIERAALTVALRVIILVFI